MILRLEAPDAFRPDDIYAKLLAVGQGLNERDQRRAMAALVLLLANHIADEAVLDEAIALVRGLPPTRGE